ncbi:PepSY domain-containing protein [Actinomadura madurae]|uniref:PepSY domain-containing protein n=1 Tax=Actinomadura madurae TaxID=1993 RepID=UPI0020D25689|nr:PepSY domain-containing protein [Actinomadura madurae]MCP9971878.1 PepSY domain-containing protein [Actinomadura madurae]MCQ0020576.1 PepSY domain-containing protein [Actinomadura madurae]
MGGRRPPRPRDPARRGRRRRRREGHGQPRGPSGRRRFRAGRRGARREDHHRARGGAAEKAVSGRATSTEFEREHGRAVWVADVTGRNGTAYEVTVDAATGGVLSKETDQD